MPIYDYHCDHCGHAFSAVQSFKDDPVASCPNCGKRPRRLLAPPAIVFKGSGWYKTDSRASSAKKESSGDKEGAKESTTGTSETKGDTKSETKADKGSAKSSEAAS